MEFGDKIKALRDRLKLTQREFARQTGLSQQSVTVYENGLRKPSWESVQKIVAGLGITYEELADKAVVKHGRRSRKV